MIIKTKFNGYGPGGRRLYFKGGGGDGTTTSTTMNYSPEESAQRVKVQTEAGRVYGMTQPFLEGSAYPGSNVVPFSSETQQAQNLAVWNAINAQPSINAINQGVQFGLTDARDVESNPYLQNAIMAATRPVTEKYMDPTGVMSTIRTGAQEAGQFGGSRQGIAEGVAAGRYMQEVGDISSKMASEGYNRGLDTFEKTLMFAPQAMETSMQPVNWLSSVGAQKESLAQAEQDYLANQRMWELNAPWLGLQNYASIVFGGAPMGTTSTSNGGGYQRSPLMGALGGAATGYSLGGPVGAGLGALVGLFG